MHSFANVGGKRQPLHLHTPLYDCDVYFSKGSINIERCDPPVEGKGKEDDEGLFYPVGKMRCNTCLRRRRMSPKYPAHAVRDMDTNGTPLHGGGLCCHQCWVQRWAHRYCGTPIPGNIRGCEVTFVACACTNVAHSIPAHTNTVIALSNRQHTVSK